MVQAVWRMVLRVTLGKEKFVNYVHQYTPMLQRNVLQG